MLSNKLALGVIALVGILGAAGAGAYIASRQSAPVDRLAPVATAPSTTPAATGAVEATEAVMDDPGSSPGSSGASSSAPAGASTSAPTGAAADKRADKTVDKGASHAAADKTADKPVTPAAKPARKTARPPDRPVASSREHQNTTPVSQPPRDAHSGGSADTHTARTEPAIAETRPIETDRTARGDRPSVEPTAPPPPPAPQFVEVTVPADSVIGLQIETALSSETAHVEDRVTARVTRDVRADGRIAIPAGSRVLGSVSVVDRGGKMKEQARLGVRFHTVILADGTELPLQTETVLREGESPTQASAAKVGGAAIGGAILGAILGGGKGAAIGGAVGAAGGTTAVMAGGRKPAQIAAGSPVTVKVLSPVTVTVEKE